MRRSSKAGRTSTGLLPLLVALLVLIVGWVEAGQLCPLFHFLDQPAFEKLMLCALVGDKVDQILWNHHGAIIVRNDDIVGKNRTAATSDRFIPANEGQLVYRGRSRNAGTPDRQSGP